MKIGILGATSQIAKDLIISFRASRDYKLTLFSRSPERVQQQFNLLGLTVDEENLSYTDFSHSRHYDVIINFVGVGNPAQAKMMGAKIFEVTEYYDNIALDYIRTHPDCKYIFMSSGAVYGDAFNEPVDQHTPAKININNLQPTDWYSVAKLNAEAKHRAMSDYSIVDVRIFNYFSHTQDMNARFLITDIVRAIKSNEILKTNSVNIVRDFITPLDFYQLIVSILQTGKINTAIDCQTKAPVDKFSLLEMCKKEFGLKYEIVEQAGVNATGSKINYYSTSKIVETIGYVPKLSSLDGIILELPKVI